MTKPNTGRGPDRYIFTNNECGRKHANQKQESLHAAGITSTKTEEVLTSNEGSTLLIIVTVTGKRPGAGRIAADMKERKS